MPLKLLKRTSKQYNVVSKSTFVISVELLDNGVMECTLDTESTGADCLLNISQRLGLHQPEFFGLRYISRGVPPRQRWVDLERPLKKQLEKYAQDSQLSLGVMFYVADVNLLKDEMTRYHYFLQLKSDVIDGKLNCSIDQAISLAAYSLQAEFGDYHPERHTIDYLRDFAILPKELTTESKFQDLNVEALYEAVTRQYGSLVGFPPPLAEIYYIMVAQQLDGYGQSAFPAKDDSGNDILFCASANGLVIRRRDWTHIAAFRFSDIKSLVGHKKALVVQGSHSQRSIQFHFTDPEVVKYVKKICLLQSSFCKENLKTEQSNAASETSVHSNNYSIISGSSATTDNTDGQSRSSSSMNLREATPELTSQSSSAIYENQYSLHSNNNNVTFNHAGVSGNTNPSFGGGGNGSSNIISSLGFNLQMLQQQHRLHPNSNMNSMLMNQQQRHPVQSSSQDLQTQLQLSQSVTPISTSNTNVFGAGGGRGVSPQTSLNFNLPNTTNVNMNPDTLLPNYRAAPDYQTAVHLKYGPSISNNINIKASPTNNGDQYYYSNGQQDEEEPIYENEIVSQMHSIELGDSNSEKQVLRGNLEALAIPMQAQPQQQQQIFSISSDDPNSYLYKPPPPYPGTSGTRTNPTTNNFEPPAKSQDGTFTKLKPNLNNHSDVLRQIEAQLKQSNLFLPQGNNPSALPETNKLIESTPNTISLNSLTSTASKSQRNSGASLTQEKGISANKPSKSNSSYHKLNDLESGTFSSTANTSSSSSFGANEFGSHNSSVSSLTAQTSKAKASLHQNRKLNDMQKANSKAKVSMGELYSSITIDPNILHEFQRIPKAKPGPNFTTAMKRENSKRNRCPSVLPYEDNSIRLSSSRQNPDGYTNASPVSAVVSGREWKYIVGQIPLAGNIPSIWQIIWETDAKIIATLEKDSTALFYPLDSSTSSSSSALNTMFFGDFQIVDSKSDKGNTASIAREVTLIYLPKRLQRKVWILPYEDEWKDDIPIHTEHFLCFLEEVNSIQRKVSDPVKPLVVLCGTGAGRCGILVLSDILLHAADSGHKLRCDSLLAELRTQRMLLVNSPAQYAFVLHTLEKYLAQSRLI